MSRSGRICELMDAWQRGYGQAHNTGHLLWGADPCDACTAERDAWDIYQEALLIDGRTNLETE